MKGKMQTKPMLFVSFLLAALGLMLTLQSCDASKKDDAAADAGAPCVEDDMQCVGAVVWLCRLGVFQPWENCAAFVDTATLNPVMQCVEYDVYWDTDDVPDATEAVCEPVPEDTDGDTDGTPDGGL